MKGNANRGEGLNIDAIEHSLMKVLFYLNVVVWSKILFHAILVHGLADLGILII